MTVQEAIKKNISECKRRIFRIKDFLKNNKDANIDKCRENIFVLETTIQALDEVEQYRALGTVEELKEEREKQVVSKPLYRQGTLFKWIDTVRERGRNVNVPKWSNRDACPNCKKDVLKTNYCPNCGQALDWSEEDD